MSRSRGRVRSPVVGRLDTDVESTQESILDELRRVLVSGGAPPGSALPPDEIAAAFGVSRIPVREALKTLTGEGLVQHEPRGGYTVARLTLADFSELYVVRGALENAALGPAATHAGPAEVDRATAVHIAQGAALRRGDAKTYHSGSRAFHRALVEPSGMKRLVHLVESTWNITEPAQPMTLLPAASLHAMHDDHAGMLAAWVAADIPLLLELANAHTEHLRAALLTLPPDLEAFAKS